MISLHVDTKDVEHLLKLLPNVPRDVQKCMLSAARRSGQDMRTDVSRGIKAVSFLKARDIKRAITDYKVTGGGGAVEVSFRVATKSLAADRFRLKPNRITARKGKRSRNWPETGFQIGPAEPVRYADRSGGRSRGALSAGAAARRSSCSAWGGVSSAGLPGIPSSISRPSSPSTQRRNPGHARFS